jgi:hypothetical protein
MPKKEFKDFRVLKAYMEGIGGKLIQTQGKILYRRTK